MKTAALLALVALSAITSAAQVSATAAVRRNPSVVPTVRPPASAAPSPAAQNSTALAAAARSNRAPLKVLPGLHLSGRDGLVASPRALAPKAHWLLLYREAKCVPCDRLMNVLAAGAAAKPGQEASYVIIVDGHDRDALDSVRAKYASLANATWLADRNHQVMTMLKPRGTPMLYAMDGEKIVWSVPGTLGDAAMVERRASDWIAKSPEAPGALSVPGGPGPTLSER
jgi:hypothetical protein